jgi:hypothetical protein
MTGAGGVEGERNTARGARNQIIFSVARGVKFVVFQTRAARGGINKKRFF